MTPIHINVRIASQRSFVSTSSAILTLMCIVHEKCASASQRLYEREDEKCAFSFVLSEALVFLRETYDTDNKANKDDDRPQRGHQF